MSGLPVYRCHPQLLQQLLAPATATATATTANSVLCYVCVPVCVGKARAYDSAAIKQAVNDAKTTCHKKCSPLQVLLFTTWFSRHLYSCMYACMEIYSVLTEW